MPKREEPKETDIISKFDAIDVKPALKIPPEDLAFCENLQSQMVETLLSIDTWVTELGELAKKYPSPDFLEIGRRYNGEKTIHKDWQKSKEIVAKNIFGTMRFCVEYDLLFLDGLRKKAEDALFHEIIDYFNTKYNLRLSGVGEFFRNPKQIDEYIKKVHFVEVVNWVLDECGGLDFANIGLENLKDEFRREIGSASNVEVTSKKITLTKFLYLEKSYRGDYSWGYRGIEVLEKVRKALTLYESGELGDQIWDLRPNSSDEPMFDKPYELESTTKAKSLKVFKNGKLEIRFNEVGQEKEFFELFELFKL